jgi:hypothetical protein
VKRQKSIRQPDLFPVQKRGRALPKIGEQLLEAGLPVPHEEYHFAKHVGREWRFDYAWLKFKVAYEREGATWGRVVVDAKGKKHRTVAGRHTSGAGVDADAEKYNLAAILGWVVIRGTASTERSGRAVAELEAALRARGWKDKPR